MTFHDYAALLGKRVRVKLDDNVVQKGQFLGFGDGGDFELLQDDGFVYHAWPMLSVEEVTDDAAEILSNSPEMQESAREAENARAEGRTVPLEDVLQKLGELDAAEEAVRSPADAGEGSPEGEGGPGGEEDPGSDASG